MEETTKAAPAPKPQPTSTYRRRRTFGVRDLKRLHRQAGSRTSLRQWVRLNAASIRPSISMLSAKAKAMLTARS